MKLYLNGNLKNTTLYQGEIAKTISDLLIGKWYHGSLDEIAIYDWALTESEIERHLDPNDGDGYWIF